MSTILQAQLKNKFDQAGTPPPIIQQTDKGSGWKIALFITSLIIITLLSILIYLQLNPYAEAKKTIVEAETVKPVMSPLVKVTFETQPIPVIVPLEKINKIKKIEESTPPVKVTSLEKIIQQKSTISENTSPKDPLPENIEKTEQAVDYGNTSNDLKKRFELALLLTEIEQDEGSEANSSTADELNDGSDIHEMTSAFQNKVPVISYESHVYSSLTEERWIRINGEILKEGEVDSSGQLELLEIQPQRSIFRIDRQSFSIESLVDWKGY